MKAISYKPLWKTLIDRNIKNRTDLLEIAKIGRGTLAKLSKNQEVSMTVLVKLCNALNCELSDIAEITEITDERKLKGTNYWTDGVLYYGQKPERKVDGYVSDPKRKRTHSGV